MAERSSASNLENLSDFRSDEVRIYAQAGAKIAQYSESSSTISFDALVIGQRRSSGRLSCSKTTWV